MPRIAYKTDAEAGPPDLVAAIRQRRGGRLGALDRILLYSPPYAAGWNEMMGRVRNDLVVPMPLRELAMCASMLGAGPLRSIQSKRNAVPVAS